MRTALVIIAQEGYQDREYADTRAGLEAAGFAVIVGSTNAGACHGKLGGAEQATIALADVRVSDYSRVAFIGGPGAAAFTEDPQALRVARETAASGKPLGAICIAPLILAAAGVLTGKRATVWDSGGEQATVLAARGATYTGEPVTTDGQIVTANGPAAAQAFGKALATL